MATCVIIDGAAIVQMLHPKNSRSFSEYASDVFIPYIMSQFRNATRLDLVWDRYVEDSLKSTSRAKCVKAPESCGRRRYSQKFLRVKNNKTELLNFLTKALMLAFNKDGKQL